MNSSICLQVPDSLSSSSTCAGKGVRALAGIFIALLVSLQGEAAPLTTNALWACGNNDKCQLGDGTMGISRLSPIQIVSNDVSDVSAGSSHTLIVKTDGSLWGWGENMSGALGDGTPPQQEIPIQILNSGIKAVSAGRDHTLIVKTNGSLWACGNNYDGQLGIGSSLYELSPVQILSNGVASVSAGERYTMIVKTDGSLWACGYNCFGQLGDGTQDNQFTPVQVLSAGVAAVKASYKHTIILMTDGSVWGCGANERGQLGDGTDIDALTPVAMLLDGEAIAVSAGRDHSMILKGDGSLWGCGSNDYGQTGNDMTNIEPVPFMIIDSGVVAISAGTCHTMIVKSDGALWACGANYNGELGDGTRNNSFTPIEIISNGVTAVSAGCYHTMILRKTVTVFFDEQVGTVETGSTAVTSGAAYGVLPTPIREDYTFGGWWTATNGTGFEVTASTVVTATSNHTLYAKWTLTTIPINVFFNAQGGEVSPTNKVLMLGNPYGELPTPTRSGCAFGGWWTAPQGAGSEVTSINVPIVSSNHTVYAKWTVTVTFNAQDGTVSPTNKEWTIGAAYGELPTPTRTDYVFGGWWSEPYGAGIEVTSVTVGMATTNHTLFAQWLVTVTFEAQGGIVRPTNKQIPTNGTLGELPVPIRLAYEFCGWWTEPNGAGLEITATNSVTAVTHHVLYAKWDGPTLSSVWTCGFNSYGQLGDGTTVSKSNAVQVVTNDVVGVSLGESHTMILKADGSLWGCGANHSGQLGNMAPSRKLPSLSLPNGVVSVSAGGSHTMILKADGSLWACGQNNYGQLGDGTTTHRWTPISILAGGVASVSAGGLHTMIVKANGSLWCCGLNNTGQLADGTTNTQYSLVQVLSSNVVAVSTSPDITPSSGKFSMILMKDSSLWACGSMYGKIGNGSTLPQYSPVCVMSSGVKSVSVGLSHTMILKTDGSLWGCGSNTFGQLGDGTTQLRQLPVQVLSNGVKSVSAGRGHTMIVKIDGSLWVCGFNTSGQLGIGSTLNQLTPVQIFTCGVRAVSCGQIHSAILRPSPVTVFFDGRGVIANPSSKDVTVGGPYGVLPIPLRGGFAFGGWWTGLSAGSEVNAATTVTATAGHTLYAQWMQTHALTAPVLVPYVWLNGYPEFVAAHSGDYETAANATGSNDLPVWASYVAGLVPTNPASRFIASIAVSNDVRKISWSPDLSPNRLYAVEGKTNLNDSAWGPTNASSRFFRVKVELP